MRKVLIALALTSVAIFSVAAVSQGATGSARSGGTLRGTVGPGMTISISPRAVKAGTYTVIVSDKSKIHNFHIIGTSVKTLVPFVGTKSFKVTLKKGTYHFQCDPHHAVQKGSFKVS